MATYNTELARKGPGLLLRDILSAEDPQVEAVAAVIARSRADIIVLQGVDFDHELMALQALRDRIEVHGRHFEHIFALRPNTGLATGLDLDDDGRLGAPRDAQGYGEFAGQGGMAILSRHKINASAIRDFSTVLWSDLPGALLLQEDGSPLLSPDVSKVQRLATVGHWTVPVSVDGRRLDLLTFHASPPVFDGPEDRNGRRNHDEIVFWSQVLDGGFGAAPTKSFVLLGDANLDPVDAEGRKSAIHRLLDDPRVQDPEPRRVGAVIQGAGHNGDPALDTAEWPEPDPGHLRVSYILPSTDIGVRSSGILDLPEDPDLVSTASRHRLVWVDLQIE